MLKYGSMSFSPLTVNRFEVAGIPLTVKFPYPPVPLTTTPGAGICDVSDVATGAGQLRDFRLREGSVLAGLGINERRGSGNLHSLRTFRDS